MVTNPHRIVILILLKVLWIWRPRGRMEAARPREPPLAVGPVVGRVPEFRF